MGAPVATKKDTLFDWQMENDGVKSIDRFGGVEALLESFGTDPKTVCCLKWLLGGSILLKELL